MNGVCFFFFFNQRERKEKRKKTSCPPWWIAISPLFCQCQNPLASSELCPEMHLANSCRLLSEDLESQAKPLDKRAGCDGDVSLPGCCLSPTRWAQTGNQTLGLFRAGPQFVKCHLLWVKKTEGQCCRRCSGSPGGGGRDPEVRWVVQGARAIQEKRVALTQSQRATNLLG